jgi:hypothetical protein
VTIGSRIAILATTQYVGHGIDLQRSIDTVSARRNRFSLAHELGHLTLTPRNPNHAGMAPAADVIKLLKCIQRSKTTYRTDLPEMRVSGGDGSSVTSLQIELLLFASGWREQRNESGQQGYVFAHSTMAEFLAAQFFASKTMRVRLRSGQAFSNSWLAYACLMDKLLKNFQREQARTAVVFRLPIVRAIGLILLAICRRYGRRAEPDDYRSLLKRLQPTFRGVACMVN